jgi:hypothetical protein
MSLASITWTARDACTSYWHHYVGTRGLGGYGLAFRSTPRASIATLPEPCGSTGSSMPRREEERLLGRRMEAWEALERIGKGRLPEALRQQLLCILFHNFSWIPCCVTPTSGAPQETSPRPLVDPGNAWLRIVPLPDDFYSLWQVCWPFFLKKV